MRPRRAVTHGPRGWEVSHSDFASVDKALAVAVAREYDRIDPLPCPHNGAKVDVTSMGDPVTRQMCVDCGETRDMPMPLSGRFLAMRNAEAMRMMLDAGWTPQIAMEVVAG